MSMPESPDPAAQQLEAPVRTRRGQWFRRNWLWIVAVIAVILVLAFPGYLLYAHNQAINVLSERMNTLEKNDEAQTASIAKIVEILQVKGDDNAIKRLTTSVNDLSGRLKTAEGDIAVINGTLGIDKDPETKDELAKLKEILGIDEDPKTPDTITKINERLGIVESRPSGIGTAEVKQLIDSALTEQSKTLTDKILKSVQDQIKATPAADPNQIAASVLEKVMAQVKDQNTENKRDFLNAIAVALEEHKKTEGNTPGLTELQKKVEDLRKEVDTTNGKVKDLANKVESQPATLPACDFQTKSGLSGTSWSYWETGVGITKSCRATVGANELMIVGGTNVKIGGSNQGSVNSGHYVVLTSGSYDLEIFSGFAGKRDKTVSLQSEYNARIDQARSLNQPVGVQVTNTSTTGIVGR